MTTNISLRDSYSNESDKKDRIIRYLTIEVLRLGGGERCPKCLDWNDIETNGHCYFCGGLGYYIPDIKEE